MSATDDDRDEWPVPSETPALRSVPNVAARAREVIAAQEQAEVKRRSAEARRRMMRDRAEAHAASMLEPAKSKRLRLVTDDEMRRGLLIEAFKMAGVCLIITAAMVAVVLWIGGAL